MDQTAPLADLPHQHVLFADGMALECGASLPELAVAYRTYGALNAERSNAVLVCHALTGDQYVAEPTRSPARTGGGTRWSGPAGRSTPGGIS